MTPAPTTPELAARLYEQIRAVAAARFGDERVGHTLQPTALANEAYLRLAEQDRQTWQEPAQFLCVAAEMIRRVLVDHARARAAEKRGGGRQRVTLSGLELPGQETRPSSELDVELLDGLLSRLAQVDPRRAKVVELRFFAGMTHEQIGMVLGVSTETVKLDWRFARAWLHEHLADGM